MKRGAWNGLRGNETMEKVYGKPRGGAMRGAVRWILVCAIALPVAAMPGAMARAADLLLMEETAPPANRYAWFFAGLSLVSFGVAYNGYAEDEYNTAKAKKAYKNYQAATTPAAALAYRDETVRYINRAQSYESTANAALIAGSVLALTAIAIFRSEGSSMAPILLSDRGVEWTFRF